MKNPIHFYEFFPDNNHFHCRFGRRRQTARSPLLRFQSRSESVGHLRLTNGIHRLPLRRLGQDAEPAVVQQGKEQPGIGLARAIKAGLDGVRLPEYPAPEPFRQGRRARTVPRQRRAGRPLPKAALWPPCLSRHRAGRGQLDGLPHRLRFSERGRGAVAFFVKIFDPPAAAKIRIHVEGVAEIGSSAAEEPLLLPGQPDLPRFRHGDEPSRLHRHSIRYSYRSAGPGRRLSLA